MPAEDAKAPDSVVTQGEKAGEEGPASAFLEVADATASPTREVVHPLAKARASVPDVAEAAGAAPNHHAVAREALVAAHHAGALTQGTASEAHHEAWVHELGDAGNSQASVTVAPIIHWLPPRLNVTKNYTKQVKQFQTDMSAADNATIKAGVKAVKKLHDAESMGDAESEHDSFDMDERPAPGSIPLTPFTIGAPVLTVLFCLGGLFGFSGSEEADTTMPKMLQVSGTETYDGVYTKMKDRKDSTGHPVWQNQQTGYFLFSTPSGKWAFAGKEAEEAHFMIEDAGLATENPHGNLPPHESQEWQKLDEAGIMVSDTSIKIHKL